MAEIKTLGPVGLNPLGNYNSETEYEKLDVVLYQGSSYVALQTVQGQVPTNTEYWQKLVTGGMDIVDNLESEDTQKALSANQGKVLNNTAKNTLTCNLEYRDCDEYIAGITDETTPIKGYLQGFTTTPTSYIVTRAVGGSLSGKSNMVYLEEISKSTKETIKSAYLELFHANSIAYNEEDKEIYVAALSGKTDQGADYNNNDIIIVDYDTFTIKETITPSANVTDITRVRSVSYDNENKVLALAGNTDIFIMKDWETVEKHIELNLDNTAQLNNPLFNHGTIQNCVVYNNKIYVTRYFATGISIFDLEGNLIKEYYSFDYDIPINIGELESIAIEQDETIYLASHQTSGSNNSIYDIKDITIFKTNLKYNGYKNFDFIYSYSSYLTVYVDCDTTNHYQVGTETCPFKSIQQAIIQLQSIKIDKPCVIELQGTNKQYSFLMCRTNRRISLHGNNNKLYGMQIEGSKIIVSDIIINNDVSLALNISYPANVLIRSKSKVTLDNFSIVNNSENKHNYGIYIADADVNISSVSFAKFVNAIALDKFANIKVTTITVTNVDYYYYPISLCFIGGLSNAILNRCNPNTSVIPTYENNQYIRNTFDTNTNTLEFENKNIETSSSGRNLFYVDATFSVDNLNFSTHFLLHRTEFNTFTFITSNKQTKYEFCVKTTHTNYSGIWVFDIRAIKTDLLTGTITDVSSDATMNITNVLTSN